MTDGRDTEERGRLLNLEELKDILRDDIISVGSHTVNHPVLRNSVLSPEEIRYELKTSKQYLEENLGRQVTMLSFPFGACDEQVVQLAREAGYHRAFLSIPLGTMTNIGGLIAGRVEVSPTDSLFSLWLKAVGGYQFLPFMISIKAWLLRRPLTTVRPRSKYEGR
jgi:peptidoglycan/xylan/chitin deacetylase (PgdA/CDA1 family)